MNGQLNEQMLGMGSGKMVWDLHSEGVTGIVIPLTKIMGGKKFMTHLSS
jgi:hypothetical protein